MGYERYPRGTDQRRDDDGRQDPRDYGRDYRAGRDDGYASGRGDAGGYGQRDYGNQRYAQRDAQYRGGGGGGRGGPVGEGYAGAYQAREENYDRSHGDVPPEYRGYASGGRRFDNPGRDRGRDDDNYRGGDYGRAVARGGQARDYDYEDRGFFQRAGDELRSWFGDDDAERRRDMDARYDERLQGGQGRHRDSDYHSWRSDQIASLDRDYDEYRRENRSRFESEFSTWRAARQGQRDSLAKVAEHMDVLGSDSEHVGTVDKVRGDRIVLTKSDEDAGGRHHSIPSNWIQSVDTRGVTLTRTAADAKQHWRDAEQNRAMFGDGEGADHRYDETSRRLNAGAAGSSTY